MAARGVPRTTVDAWYRDRARTGHPEAGRIGRTDYWYEDEWTAWYQGHLRGKVGSLTQVDRGGTRTTWSRHGSRPDAALRQPACDSRQPPPGLLPRARRLREGRQGTPCPIVETLDSGRPPTAVRVWAAAANRALPVRRPSPTRTRETSGSPASLPSSCRRPAVIGGTRRRMERQPAHRRTDHPHGEDPSLRLTTRFNCPVRPKIARCRSAELGFAM